MSFDAAQWAEIGPKVRDAIVRTEQMLTGVAAGTSGSSDAEALGDEWRELLWPAGARRVEYWFTN